MVRPEGKINAAQNTNICLCST